MLGEQISLISLLQPARNLGAAALAGDQYRHRVLIVPRVVARTQVKAGVPGVSNGAPLEGPAASKNPPSVRLGWEAQRTVDADRFAVEVVVLHDLECELAVLVGAAHALGVLDGLAKA